MVEFELEADCHFIEISFQVMASETRKIIVITIKDTHKTGQAPGATMNSLTTLPLLLPTIFRCPPLRWCDPQGLVLIPLAPNNRHLSREPFHSWSKQVNLTLVNPKHLLMYRRWGIKGRGICSHGAVGHSLSLGVIGVCVGGGGICGVFPGGVHEQLSVEREQQTALAKVTSNSKCGHKPEWTELEVKTHKAQSFHKPKRNGALHFILIFESTHACTRALHASTHTCTHTHTHTHTHTRFKQCCQDWEFFLKRPSPAWSRLPLSSR